MRQASKTARGSSIEEAPDPAPPHISFPDQNTTLMNFPDIPTRHRVIMARSMIVRTAGKTEKSSHHNHAYPGI